MWIRQFLNELKVEAPIGVYLLHRDNKTSIILTKNAENQAKTKHIDVQHYYIYELVVNKEVEIEWICSARILADRFTKTLSNNSFKHYQDLLGLTS